MKQLCIGLLVLVGFTACGGGGGAAGTGGAASILPAGSATSALTTSTSAISTSGSVTSLFSGGFILQTGYPHGNIDVKTSASTVITGPAPYAGESVAVSGSGSWSTSIAATAVSQVTSSSSTTVQGTPSPAPVATVGAVIPVPTGVVSTSGTISSLNTKGFLLNQGPPHGMVDITLTSATLQIGKAAANEYVEVTGTGSPGTAMTATVATYSSSAPGSVTVSGTVTAGTSYGFSLNTGSAALPIVLTPAAVIAGAPLAVGSTAKVVGVGTAASSITAVEVVVTDPTPTPGPQSIATATPGPISQTHILTGDYLAGYYGTTTVAYATAAKYLTWAQTTGPDSSAMRSVGIKTMLYTNPNRVEPVDPMYTSDEATFAHDCNGNRISISYNGNTQYVMNVESPDLASLYATTIRNLSSGTQFDAVFEDNEGPLEVNGVTTMPCSYTDAAWLSGENELAAASPYPIIFNGLSGLNGHNPSLTVPEVMAPNTAGGLFEHCYSDEGTPEQSAWLWQAIENTELEIAADNGGFFCMARDTDSASANTTARIYALASFLLTYNPNTSVLWEEYSTPSGLHVMPEEGLVVMNPTTSAPSSIAGLQTSSGAYGRQYGACYLAGKFVGPCAIAVNSGQVTETFPYPQYNHTLAISGAGVLDGGVVSTQGAAAPLTMAPETAVIAFP